MSDYPIPGKMQDFLDGIYIIRGYCGGTTEVEARGSTIHIINVNWPDITEANQKVLRSKGWVPHPTYNYPMWVSES